MSPILLQWLTVIFIGLAALFWFMAAVNGGRSFRNTPFEVLEKSFASQARYNAMAAACATIAAVAQMINMYSSFH
jgi:hypothetical protein